MNGWKVESLERKQNYYRIRGLTKYRIARVWVSGARSGAHFSWALSWVENERLNFFGKRYESGAHQLLSQFKDFSLQITRKLILN